METETETERETETETEREKHRRQSEGEGASQLESLSVKSVIKFNCHFSLTISGRVAAQAFDLEKS